MPSILRTTAIAAFAAFASAQTFTNSTAPSSATFPGWKYDGCKSVASSPGVLIETSPFMTVERCLLDCSNYGFAFISGTSCFCGDADAGLTDLPDSSCNNRCAGNSNEACGGVTPAAKRQAVGSIVSVYERLEIIPEGDVYVTVINNVFIDFCSSCNNNGGGLTTVTYLSTATLTGCGCKTTPTIPTTVVTYPCSISGTPTTVTLTVPAGVTPGACTAAQCTAPVTTVVPCATCTGSVSTITVSPCPGCSSTAVYQATTVAPKAMYTGAAGAVKAGSGLLAGAVAVAALL